MKNLPERITDPVYVPQKSFNRYERFFLSHIYDKRDLPFIKLLAIIHLTIIPAGIILYSNLLNGIWWWLAAFIYFYFSQLYFKGPFGLMLHCLCHRKTFRTSPKFITKYIHWFICPFFGHLGDSYFSHHLGMHHIEGNMPTDTSSTMGYQRDSKKDFLKYWGHFMILGAKETFHYLFARKRKKLYRQLTANESGFFIIVILLSILNLKATFVVFILPFLFARLVMMIGNWTQHAFVDPLEPENDFANSIICLNTSYNQKCWNDGYHALHHFRPGAHYTEYPLLFKEHIHDIAKNKTLVFLNIHYLHVFYYLMTRQYKKLAVNLVNVNNSFLNEHDAIQLMKNRTQKFSL